MSWITDISVDKSLCLSCYKLNDVGAFRCARCDEKLEQRKEGAFVKTLALTLGATLLLIPANILPMMIGSSFGAQTIDTIFSGVLYFIGSQEYLIAVIIFLASICIPFIKVSILSYLLWIVRFKKREHALRGVRLYRFIRFIGKYSMLDVFVVAIMVSTVQFGNMVDVSAGSAALFFALAVILTIFATESFDPRLMWEE